MVRSAHISHIFLHLMPRPPYRVLRDAPGQTDTWKHTA